MGYLKQKPFSLKDSKLFTDILTFMGYLKPFSLKDSKLFTGILTFMGYLKPFSLKDSKLFTGILTFMGYLKPKSFSLKDSKLFTGILTFMGYLKPKSLSLKNSNGTIQPIAGVGIKGFILFPRVFFFFRNGHNSASGVWTCILSCCNLAC